MTTENRGGRNRIAIKWNGLPFTSYAALSKHLGKDKSTARTYWDRSIRFEGYYIEREDGTAPTLSISGRKSDENMLDFYRYMIVNKLKIKEFGEAEMLRRFKISRGLK